MNPLAGADLVASIRGDLARAALTPREATPFAEILEDARAGVPAEPSVPVAGQSQAAAAVLAAVQRARVLPAAVAPAPLPADPVAPVSGLTQADQVKLLTAAGIPTTLTRPADSGWVEWGIGIYTPNATGTDTDGQHGLTSEQYDLAAAIVSPYESAATIARQLQAAGIDIGGTALESVAGPADVAPTAPTPAPSTPTPAAPRSGLTQADQVKLLTAAGIPTTLTRPADGGWIEWGNGIYTPNATGTDTDGQHGLTSEQYDLAAAIVSPYESAASIARQLESTGVGLRGTPLQPFAAYPEQPSA